MEGSNSSGVGRVVDRFRFDEFIGGLCFDEDLVVALLRRGTSKMSAAPSSSPTTKPTSPLYIPLRARTHPPTFTIF